MTTEHPVRDGGMPLSSDPRSDASFAQLVWASINSRFANRARRVLLSGTMGLRATDPERSRTSNFRLEALRGAEPPFYLASLTQPDRTRRLVEHSCPEEVSRILERAAALENGSIELLGGRWECLPPDWHSDAARGVVWDATTPGRKILDHYPDSQADPKRPWELARFQFALPLVQAWWLTRETHWAQTYFELVDSWIESNPFPFGIHWASAMEVALRATSWTYALWHLRDAKCLDEDLWQRWRASLEDHERYVRICLETERLGNGNHYVANILGLASLYRGLPGLASASRSRSAKRRLEREVHQQTLEDGANFEGSTAYHQFVTEMFVWALATSNSYSDAYHEQVASQLRYLDALCRADGSIPRVGDDDSGRIMPLSSHHAPAILDAGFALVRGAPRRRHGEKPTLDLLFTGGEEALHRWRASARNPVDRMSMSFPCVGLHLHEESGWHVAVNTGPERCRASGGHLHSDLISVVAHVESYEFLCDPGTLGYAGSRDARDTLRSAAAHSTVRPLNIEPRRLLEKFRTAPSPLVRVRKNDGWLDLKCPLTSEFTVDRRIRLSHGPCLEILDEVNDVSRKGFELNFILGSGHVDRIQEADETLRIVQETPIGLLEICCESPIPLNCEIVTLNASSGYGRPLLAHRIRIQGTSNPRGSIRSTLRFSVNPG